MSKGIVMEKHRKYTIIMTQDGSFHKVRPVRDAGIGAEVSYEILAAKKNGFLFFQSHKQARYVAIACVALLLVMPFYFLVGQNKTYAYVNLDINPSIEIEVDEDLRVVSIEPLNQDAEKLLEHLSSYKDKEIEYVIEEIMNKSDMLDLTKNGKNVLVGVSYVNAEDVAILDTVDKYFLTHNTSWDIATFKVPKELHARAAKENISMNKVMANTMDKEVPDSEKEVQIRLNDDEKELIHSFYSNSKSSHQNTEKSVPVSDGQDVMDPTVVPKQKPKKEQAKQRQSKPEQKNSEVHSHAKNQHAKPVQSDNKDNKGQQKKHNLQKPNQKQKVQDNHVDKHNLEKKNKGHTHVKKDKPNAHNKHKEKSKHGDKDHGKHKKNNGNHHKTHGDGKHIDKNK